MLQQMSARPMRTNPTKSIAPPQCAKIMSRPAMKATTPIETTSDIQREDSFMR